MPLAAGLLAVAAATYAYTSAPACLERRHGLHDLPADRADRGRGLDVSRRGDRVVGGGAGLQLLLPAAGRHVHDRRSAELDGADHVPRGQPGGQQPVGGGAGADRRSARAARRAGASVRPQPRRAADHRGPRCDQRPGALDRPPLRPRPTSRLPCRAGPRGICSRPVRSRSRSIRISCRWPSRARKAASSSTPPSAPTPAIAMTMAGEHSVRLVPLRVGTRPIGLLAATGRPVEPGTLDALAAVVAIAIERASLLDERKAAEIARRGDELKTALLASLAHDLRTPLTAIRVAASNLQSPAFDADAAARAGRSDSRGIRAPVAPVREHPRDGAHRRRRGGHRIPVGASVGDRHRGARPGGARASRPHARGRRSATTRRCGSIRD